MTFKKCIYHIFIAKNRYEDAHYIGNNLYLTA